MTIAKHHLTGSEEIKPVLRLADGRQLGLSRPLVMGILNVTPDSFSDGGRFSSEDEAVAAACRMEDEGADIIDIGGESSRPGAEPVSLDEELQRVIPVIEAIHKRSQIPISIDTYKSQTAKAALEAGAVMVNDISALRFDPDMAAILAKASGPVILMHMLGTPLDMQQAPSYLNCVEEIAAFFEERIESCHNAGINKSRLILDPGIGFGKRLSDNIDILAGVRRFTSFRLPILIGASRKSFIGMLHPSDKTADKRTGGSIAAAVTAVINGAAIVRVHDVALTVEALKVTQAVRETV
ncbi:MAG: dihydropteroate synthase [candidate division Zixibacteria bacterium]|nr:dihydropteroate synthase [candidate division Zixibacteria bacterium]